MECGCSNNHHNRRYSTYTSSSSSSLTGIIWVLLILVTGCSGQYTNCYAFGTEHVLTFDNARIDFSSPCKFELAYTCTPTVIVPALFRVNIQNVMVDQVSMVDCVEVLYEDFSVTLCRDQTATFDGSAVDTLIAANGELMVYTGTAGKEVAIHVDAFAEDENILVTLTPTGMVRVSVPDTYSSSSSNIKLCGMCGNFNLDPSDDLTTSTGSDVSAESAANRGALIAGSYLLPESSNLNCQTAADVEALEVSDCRYASSDSLTDNEIQNDIDSPDACGAYSLSNSAFTSCINANPELTTTFSAICEYDFCENYLTMTTDPDIMSSGDCLVTGECDYNYTEAKTAINRVAEVYIDECRTRGVEITDWRTDYSAELTCTSNLIYDFSGEKCPDVCGLPADRCSQSDREGCRCQDGYFRDGSASCVKEPDCGCSDPVTGSYYMTDDTWLDSTCSTQFTCYGAGNITQSAVSCSVFAECTIVDGSYECVCNTDYAGDGFTCERSCPAGEQPTSNNENCELCPIGYYNPDEGLTSCTACDAGLVTLELGSTDSSACQEIVMLPDADLVYGNGDCVTDVYDSAYRFVIPDNVLPDGLPFGLRSYTTFYPSTNGLISFGKAFVGRDPVSLGLNNDEFEETIAAPYWFRQDLRRVQSGNQEETKLCMSSYNVIDEDADRAQESQVITSIISIMLRSSPTIDPDFTPTYSFVATWYKSFAFPYVWYDADDIDDKEYATYQAVISTDGVRTYLMYIYPSGTNNTQLRRLNEFRNIYMGYNAADDATSFSLYLSTTTEIVGLHTEPSNTDTASRWVFDVANRGEPNPYAESCIAWYSEQQALLQTVSAVSNLVCPCNRLQAIYDERFFYDYSTDCVYSLFTSQGYYLICRYDPVTGVLITDPRLAGFRSEYNPILNPTEYYSNDQLPFENCCTKSDHCTLFRDYRPVESCYDPVLYTPPQLCAGFGEPHIYTLDGQLYTFNPVGEFWMIKSELLSMQSRMVQWINPTTSEAVQATQFQAFAMRSNVSGTLSDEIHIELNNNRSDFIMYKNKVSITPSILIENSLTPFNGGTIKNFNQSITVSFDTGHTFRFSLGLSILSVQSLVPQTEKGKVLGLLGTYNDDPSDDITASDGTLVCDITTNCDDKTDIHQVFGESYRITADESLFWYRYTWDTSVYTDVNFAPVYLDMASAAANNATVIDACNNDAACIYDTLVTESQEIGVYTSTVEAEVMSNAKVLLNKAPVVEGLRRIQVMVNQTVTALYNFADPDDSTDVLNIFKTTVLPEESFTIDGNTLNLTWTPTNNDEVTLSMYAMENNTVENALTSEELHVQFYIAPDCQNGASANYSVLAPGGTVTPLFYRVICDCLPGWEGEDCSIDIDGCADDPCYLANCTDIPADEVDVAQYTCDAVDCPTGFNRTDGRNESIDECFDIDECILRKPCDLSLCVNTLGSFYCNCPTGFILLNEDDPNCTDINECELRIDECTDICTNTEGAYECSCYPGGTLRPSDNKTCDIIMTDTLCGGLYNCSYACINETTGECGCPRTQMLDPADNQTCILLDECSDSTLNGCDASTNATCEDLDSGYKCNCPIGYIISDNQYTCESCSVGTYGEDCLNMCHCEDKAKTCDNILGCTDCNPGWTGDQCRDNINECNQTDACPDNSDCVDTDGSYQCICYDGYRYTLNNSSPVCENINECLEESEPCSVNADCVDLIGSAKYQCTCKDGYEGDGQTCININECLLSGDVCVDTALRCEDEIPGYNCICRTGAQGDGKVNGTGCTDVNECLDAINACPANNSICTNTDPSYQCSCAPYYTGDGYFTCEDIDECSVNGTEALCGAVANGNTTCINLEPSYECDTDCWDGYYEFIDNDGTIQCININECTNPSVACPDNRATCVDKPGNFRCDCPAGYDWIYPSCVDINECITTSDPCIGQNEQCINLSPGFTCSCYPGYIEPNCERNETLVEFLTVDQVLDLKPLPEWSNPNSPEYYYFLQNFTQTIQPLFNTSSGGGDDAGSYVGIIILNVTQDTDDPEHTRVTYEVVYNNTKPIDIEHKTFHTLRTTDYELTYNNQTVRDLGQIEFGGRIWTCSDIVCVNNFTCANDEVYPYCACEREYSGYNCAIKSTIPDPGTEDMGNLLPLWISVAVASALLVVGMCACCMFLLVTYRRRRRRRCQQPPVHRYPAVRVAGPAIFNPSSRVPAEAYNYQFPRGSIRSTASDGSMSSEGLSSRTGPTSRVGSSVPFAPRWPRAYYSQLADLTDG